MPNATIEGFQCTLFYDYDCHRDNIISCLSDDGKIEWLEKRMNMVFLDPLKRIYDRTSTAHRELTFAAGGPPMTPMLMTTSLLMNGIEALGSFLTKSEKNHTRFRVFLQKYLPAWTETVTAPYHGRMQLSEILWKSYRNGLAHSFAILHAGIDDVQGTAKYKIADAVLQIDGWKFFADLVQAIGTMFPDVRTKPKLRKQFLKRFNDVYSC